MVNVGIHCGYNVFVPEPLLNCLHVGTCLNQLCGMGMAQAVIIKIDSKLLPDDSLAIGKAVFGCQLSVFINADKIDSPRACGKDFFFQYFSSNRGRGACSLSGKGTAGGSKRGRPFDFFCSIL